MSDPLTHTSELSPKKRALLDLLLKGKRAASANERAIPRRTCGDVVPLSYAQQRLWFLEQLEPDSGLYNESAALQLVGALCVEALRQALDAMVHRHEILRTTFAVSDGVPVQVVRESRRVELRIIDLAGRVASERDVDSALHEEVRRPFDLSSDLMLRATLVRLEPQKHILLLVMHHIASDGWSLGVLFRELGTLYAAYRCGQAVTLAPLPLQYADFAIWQRQWLDDARLEAQLSYWKQRLSGISTLDLPTDRALHTIAPHAGASQAVALSTALTAKLKALSRAAGVTLFGTLLAAFQTLLHRYTEHDDIAVGSPVRRSQPDRNRRVDRVLHQ